MGLLFMKWHHSSQTAVPRKPSTTRMPGGATIFDTRCAPEGSGQKRLIALPRKEGTNQPASVYVSLGSRMFGFAALKLPQHALKRLPLPQEQGEFLEDIVRFYCAYLLLGRCRKSRAGQMISKNQSGGPLLKWVIWFRVYLPTFHLVSRKQRCWHYFLSQKSE